LVFLLLAITAFVSLRSPFGLFLVPNLASRFISIEPNYWGTAYHYNSILMPVLFIAALDAISRARGARPLAESAGPPRRWARATSVAMHRHGAVAILAVSVALVPQFSFNQFFDPRTFTFDARTDALRHAISLVPDGVTVETTLNMLAPLAARDDTFWVGNKNPTPDYVVFDQVVSGFSPPIINVLDFENSRYPGADFRIVYQDQFGIYVLRRA
jgi:uncharacterized membrane protein